MNMSVAKSQAVVTQAPVDPALTRVSPAQEGGQAGQGRDVQAPENNIKVLEEVQREKAVAKGGASEEVRELAEEMNEIMDDLKTSLGFSIRDELPNQVVVEIKNRETGDLIRQIPAEQLISIKEKMDEFTGMIFDTSA
jgi:flagellar protein FlaG